MLTETLQELHMLGMQALRAAKTVTGVQPKMSLELKGTANAQRFTIVGLWGSYILKPPSEDYPDAPVLEDATMHMAEVLGIKTAQHTLYRLQDGNLVYLTKRFDRVKQKHGTLLKLLQEDMCQLTGRLTEDKDKGSLEQVGKIIKAYTTNPGNEALTFWEQVLFSFLVGNSDMHLKNYSLLTDVNGVVRLTPAYDLLPTQLITQGDTEEVCLTLAGKKKKLALTHFLDLAYVTLGITEKVAITVLKRFNQRLPKALELLNRGWVNAELVERYTKLIQERANTLQLLPE